MHEGNGVTGTQQPHKITKKVSAMGNKPNKRKLDRKTKIDNV